MPFRLDPYPTWSPRYRPYGPSSFDVLIPKAARAVDGRPARAPADLGHGDDTDLAAFYAKVTVEP